MNPEERSVFGRRLRALRAVKHVSQKELAQRAGVTPGFLSQLERGSTGATVSTALRLAIALGVSMSDLFDSQMPPAAVTRRVDRPDLGRNAAHEMLLLTPAAHPGVEIYWSSLAPGGSSADASYTHGESDEFVIAIEGVMTCIVGSQRYELRPGDTLMLRTSDPHLLVNESDLQATVVTVATPSTQGAAVEFVSGD